MSAVTLTNLCKDFGGAAPALKCLELLVTEGELLVLIGPSGCGKSTTLRVIAGLEEPTSGRVLIDGVDVTRSPPAARNVAMVFQDYALLPHLTVRENISFGLKMRRIKRTASDERVAGAARALRIEELLDRRPGELSGGERQRVALARALAGAPGVLLLDEPLSNLDAQLRNAIRIEIAQLQRSTRLTTIYVTHDQTEAMSLGDRVAVLNAGTLQQVGAPLEIYRRPANAFVATFMGSPAMNTFRGTVAAGFVHLEGRKEQLMVAPDDTPEGPVIIGVRPEHIQVAGAGARLPPAVVDRVEQLGAEVLVHVTASYGQFVLRQLTVGQLQANDRIEPVVSPEAVHLFARDSGGSTDPVYTARQLPRYRSYSLAS